MLPSQVGVTLLLFVTAAGAPGATAGQAQELASRKPRFLAAWALPGKTVDMRSEVLMRRVSLELGDVTVDDALKEITRQANLEISYTKELLPRKLVSLHVREITVAAALTEVLLDAGLDIALTRTGRMAVVRRAPEAKPAPPDTGAIVGRVTDSGTGAPLVGATVALEGTRLTATTNTEGRYRLGRVAEGTYTLRARYIGYTPATAPTTVSAGAEAQVDFVLAKSVQQLDQVVVTGTVVPTEVKALPTPITVIDARDFDNQRPRTGGQLFRQTVPTGYFTDLGSVPAQTPVSVRGASSLAYGQSNVKVYVDGVEAAERVSASIDPSSVERIEVVRGPQAGAIYGSDAIAGVMQVFTRRGRLNEGGPHVEAEAAFGPVQSPYAGSGAIRQEYSGSVHGGSQTASYQLGGGYTHIGDWVPTFVASIASVHGGFHFEQNGVTVDATGRYYAPKVAEVIPDPRAQLTGFTPYSKPPYVVSPVQEQTYGLTITYRPTRRWHNSVTLGADRYGSDSRSTQPQLTTPADTFLYVQRVSSRKTSIAYNTSVDLQLASGASATLTAGFDHYGAELDQFYTSGALDTTGTINTDPAQPFTASVAAVTNTGYFAQAILSVRDALFLTGGLRAERNSSFGDSLGTPVSPKAGLSFVKDFGSATVKLRSSYGQGIRPPGPGLRQATRTVFQNILANPLLGPERQRGVDGGIDLTLGNQVSLSITYYDQTVRDLIQLALLDAASSPPTYQRLNVARIKNTGWELEGGVQFNRFSLRGQLGLAKSRVAALDAGYSGDLQVGDQVLGFPRYTAGALFTFAPSARTNLSAGLAIVGDRTDYDYLAMFRCFGGTGPCQLSLRDYWISYPAFAKLNLTISQAIRPGVTIFGSVDNLTNNTADESWNIVPAQGRVSLLGLRLSH